jgi:beta-glucanase (GH16 family)
MVADSPRRRRWPYHVALILAAYAAILGIAGVALATWLGSDDGEIAAGAGEATSEASSAVGQAPTDAPVRDRAGWRLVWRDEFGGARCPDPVKWSFEHGFVRNDELQWYQPGNALCDRGVLDIRARREESPVPNPNYAPGSDDWRTNRRAAEYTSASLISKRSFTYGRFEMRGRIDPRPGSWPAFWTLGTEDEWPRSGEVDILEYYRGTVLANVCQPRRTRCGWSASARQSLDSLGGRGWTNKFHVWTMEWTASRIDLRLDGKLVNRFPVARAVGRGERNPYVDRPQFLLLSQAIGGANGGDPSGTEFPVRFEVDYVRVYRRAGR